MIDYIIIIIKKYSALILINTFSGTFQKVEHVFICGVGGGIPHYTNYDKHVKLGDVVVSHYGNSQKYGNQYYINKTIN